MSAWRHGAASASHGTAGQMRRHLRKRRILAALRQSMATLAIAFTVGVTPHYGCENIVTRFGGRSFVDGGDLGTMTLSRRRTTALTAARRTLSAGLLQRHYILCAAFGSHRGICATTLAAGTAWRRRRRGGTSWLAAVAGTLGGVTGNTAAANTYLQRALFD